MKICLRAKAYIGARQDAERKRRSLEAEQRYALMTDIERYHRIIEIFELAEARSADGVGWTPVTPEQQQCDAERKQKLAAFLERVESQVLRP